MAQYYKDPKTGAWVKQAGGSGGGAPGKDGEDGKDGDPMFSNISVTEQMITLVLADGTEIEIPRRKCLTTIYSPEISFMPWK